MNCRPGLPDLSCYSRPKPEKIYQITRKNSKRPQNMANGCKIYRMDIKYTNIFHYRTVKNLPKFGFWVWNYSIWQPCCRLQGQSLSRIRNNQNVSEGPIQKKNLIFFLSKNFVQPVLKLSKVRCKLCM
jgi:hypothetical protein